VYIPKANQENDLAKLFAFMKANSFATFISIIDGEPVAIHLPLTISQQGESIICHGHFAKANPQWRVIESQSNLVIFSGPHAYISPTHYEKVESVPTWNYVAVHAYGRARLMHAESDAPQLLRVIADLIAQHEPSYQAQWDGLPDKYRDGMLNGVVGFELVIDKLEGKFKLSQNKTDGELHSIVDALSASPYEAERATASYMQAHIEQL